ncbi:MAG: DUF5677 domain-containing protein [Phycisphaerae bacterium]
MKRIASFKDSHAVLLRFFEKWMQRIDDRCSKDDQRQAAYYVWARYCMSMRTLEALLDPHLIPDLAVICRGCLEFDVALEAVLKDEQMAREYLEFDKHAKAHYLEILRKQGDLERMLMRRGQFQEMFGEAPEGFKHQSWCVKKEGTTGLMRSLGRQIDVRVYNVLSHFAHGSVWAMQMLDGRIEDPEEMFATLIDSTYTRYLNSSRAFVRFVWQPLTTPEGEECKNDFVQVMSEHIKGTT